ncbi:5372_t:CDS:1, partial [Gigaspora rosea]
NGTIRPQNARGFVNYMQRSVGVTGLISYRILVSGIKLMIHNRRKLCLHFVVIYFINIVKASVANFYQDSERTWNQRPKTWKYVDPE